MAVAASRVAKRQAAARAAKEKREKVVLVVGVVLLVAALAFEGPKTFKRIRGSRIAAAPAPALAAPDAPIKKPVTQSSAARAAVRAFPAKDPFVAQVVQSRGADAESRPADAPAVRASDFVQKDPFVQQVTEGVPGTVAGGGSAVGGGGTSAGVPAASVSGRYIVVLASIPLAEGKGAAQRGAGRARALGLGRVSVLDSSGYSTLRQGFWVVYAGPFSTLKDMLSALDAARTAGFVSAYSRRLGK